MVRLDLSKGQRVLLYPIPDDVTELICSNNQLTALPDLPAGLLILDCNDNHLTALPDLPAGLTKLICSFNRLKELPNLPAGLLILDCGYNPLTALPDLPAGLTNLDCGANRLTKLPDLPSSLVDISLLPSLFLPPELQEIIDTYRDNIPQLIISVNYYNAEKRRPANLRQAGREMATFRSILPALPGNTFRAYDPISKTLRNLKRNHNSYGPRRQRKTQSKKRKTSRRKTRSA